MANSTNHPLYPLRFHPLLRHYVWGGDKLAALGKPVPRGQTCAESWEICDRDDDQSVVAHGPLAGASLGEIARLRPGELYGRHAPQPRFPLLLKFLDARQTLSVQVHPNDAQAALLETPDLGKTEAWIVVDAEPDAVIYAGLLPGITAQSLADAIEAGECERCLHQFKPRAGDCVFLPAGAVHALGGGLLVAEIQQSSDTTYRLFDWNRVGADGQTRALHIQEALLVIDFDRGPVQPQTPQATDRPNVEQLVACDRFVLERIAASKLLMIGGDERFHLLAVLAGAAEVSGDAAGAPLVQGESILLPASLPPTELQPAPDAVLMHVYLP